MIESIRYTKELPDDAYAGYTFGREACKDFKPLACEFSAHDSLDHLLFKDGETPAKEKYLKVKDNWEYLRTMNVCKANLLTTGLYTMPRKKSDYYCPLNPKTTPLTFRETEVWLSAYHEQAPFVKK